MKLTFLGADHEVTGSCNLLTVNGKRILIDYGMEQGRDFFVNEPIPFNVAELDAVLLTHAHIDHSGMLPLLHKLGFKGPVHATQATANLCEIMLRDSAHIQEFEAEWRNRKAQRSGEEPYEPIYDMDDAVGLITQIVPHPYGKRIPVCDGIEARFTDAGHLLGSASIELWLTEDGETKKIVFSGDLGNKNQPLLNDPSYVDEADYVVVESTYGDRLHEAPPDYAAALAGVLQRTFDRGGSVVIPSFAVGRTQELLYFIRHIKEHRLLRGHDDFVVYVDSPLAIAATQVFIENGESCFDAEARAYIDKGINPISFPNLITTQTAEDSKTINYDTRKKVIISASGMCEAGRIKHHLKHNLWNPDNTVVFVGYQAEGTTGRALLDGADRIKLFGEDIAVGAEIVQLPGISGHGDANALLGWVTHFSPKPAAVFVNHGEDAVCELFSARLRDEHGLAAVAPYSGSVYDLLQEAFEYVAAPRPIEKKSVVSAPFGHEKANKPKKTQPVRQPAKPAPESAYGKLLRALERLTKLLNKGDGRSNQELKDVTRQLNDICNEWERQ